MKNEINLKQHDIDIIIFLYRFRFLTTYQIQRLMHHSYHRRINVWLTRLVENKYVKKYDFPNEVTLPTIYSLGTKGRKYLKEQYRGKEIKLSLLDRVWREQTYSKLFKKDCIFTAFIYLSLLSLTSETGASLRFYTKTDLYGMKHFFSELPQAFFAITEKTGSTKRYFFEFFPSFIQKGDIKRANKYFSYYRRGEWQKYNTNPFPEIIFFCGGNASKQYLAKVIKDKLINAPELSFSLALRDVVQKQGINKNVLEKVILE